MRSLKSRMMFSYCGFFYNLVHAFPSKFQGFFFFLGFVCLNYLVGMGKQWNLHLTNYLMQFKEITEVLSP